MHNLTRLFAVSIFPESRPQHLHIMQDSSLGLVMLRALARAPDLEAIFSTLQSIMNLEQLLCVKS